MTSYFLLVDIGSHRPAVRENRVVLEIEKRDANLKFVSIKTSKTKFKVGEQADLSCEVAGGDAINFSWTKVGRPPTSNMRVRFC